jgi:hypothetical protein
VKIASTSRIPLDREILHKLVRGYFVDEDIEVKDPLHMEGVKLSALMEILTVKRSVLSNMEKCLSDSGYIPSGSVFSGIAMARRVLSERDMVSGVLLLNCKEKMTECLLFDSGRIVDIRVLPIGMERFRLREGVPSSNRCLGVLKGALRDMKCRDRARKIVVSGRALLEEGLIEEIEQTAGIPAVAGSCFSKPGEDLPSGSAAYTVCLGTAELFCSGRDNTRFPLYPDIFRRVFSFLDKYF